MASEKDLGDRHRGIITLNIKNAETFLHPDDTIRVASKWSTIGGLDWQLKAHRCLRLRTRAAGSCQCSTSDEHLAVTVVCAPVEEFSVPAARFKASCRLRMRNSKGDDLQKVFSAEWTMKETCSDANPHVLGYTTSLASAQVLECPCNGYVTDDTIYLVGVIDVRRLDAPAGSERPSKRRFEDIKIILGDAAIYANKGILAANSEYFGNMFFGESAEREKTEVELKGVLAVDFQHFKDVIHSPYADIDDTNIVSVVYVADKFQAVRILKKCEEVIMSRMDPTNAFKILSRCDGMDGLKAQILQAMTEQELDALSEADVYGTPSHGRLLVQEYKNRRDNA